MKALISCLIISVSTTTFAAPANFCGKTDGLKQIGDYLRCQASGDLMACKALAAVVGAAGTGGAIVATTAAKARMKTAILNEAKREDVLKKLAYDLYEQERSQGRRLTIEEANVEMRAEKSKLDALSRASVERTGQPLFYQTSTGEIGYRTTGFSAEEMQTYLKWKALKEALRPNRLRLYSQTVYEPKILMLDSKSADVANLSYAEIDPVFRKSFRESADMQWRKVLEQVSAKGALNSVELKTLFGERSASALAQTFADVELSAARKLPISAAIRVAGSGAAFLLGGAASVGVLAAQIALEPTSTACTDAADGLIHREPVGTLGRSCKNVYEVNGSVLKFLETSDQRQLEAMKSNPAVCDYYANLYDHFFDQPALTKLECSGANDFKVELRTASGEKFAVQAHSVGSNSIKQLNIKDNGSAVDPMQFDGSGKPTYGVTEQSRDLYRRMKLVLPAAQECCASNDTDHAACLAQINDHVAPKIPTKAGSSNSGAIR